MRHITHTPNVEIHRTVAGAPHHAYTQCGDTQDSCRCATSRIHPMWRYTGQLRVRHITHTPNVEIHRTVAGAPHHAYTQCGDTQDSCRCATSRIHPMWRYTGQLQVRHITHTPNVEIHRTVAGAPHHAYTQCGDTQDSCRCATSRIHPMWGYTGQLQVGHITHTPNVGIHRTVAGGPHHAYTQCGDTQDSCRWATSRIHPMWRYTGQLRVRHITHTPNVEIHRTVAGSPHNAYTQCGDAHDSCGCATSRIHPIWRYTGQLRVRHITHTPNVEIHRTVAGAPHHAYTQCGDTQDSCRCATSRIHPMWRYTGQLQVRHITHTPNVEIHRTVAGAPHHAYTQCGDTQDSCRCATSRIHPMWGYTGQLQVGHITHTPNAEIHRIVAGGPHHAYTQCGDTQDSYRWATSRIHPMWRYTGQLRVRHITHTPNAEIHRIVAGGPHHAYTQCGDTRDSCGCATSRIHPMWRYTGQLQVRHITHTPNVEIHRTVAGAPHHAYTQCGDTQDSCGCATSRIHPMWRYTGQLRSTVGIMTR